MLAAEAPAAYTGAAISAAAGSHNANSGSSSILSEKVSRALQVRTDTTAMRAALDALGHLPSGVLDSRSVRAAIEVDALEQARLLQRSLRDRLAEVRALRARVRGVAEAARAAQGSVHAPVGTGPTHLSTFAAAAAATTTTATNLTSTTTAAMGGGSESNSGSVGGAAAAAAASGSSSSVLEREQQLASDLASAFDARNAAAERFRAIDDFLSTYHLSPEDQRLLEHYSFEDVPATAMTRGGEGGGAAPALGAPVNGLAFLKALERLTEIRSELQARHGGAAAAAGTAVSETMGTSSALRMMERLATQQERGYEQLYHWLQSYLTSSSGAGTAGGSGGLMDDGAGDALEEALLLLPAEGPTSSEGGSDAAGSVSNDGTGASLPHAGSRVSFVQRALQTLRHVRAFYSHLLELIATTRRTAVTRRFLLALTSGYQGMPPLELQSHDSTLYAGEMLGFCWRSLCVEADIVRGLYSASGDDLHSRRHRDDRADRRRGSKGGDNADDGDDDGDLLVGSDTPMSAEELLSTSMSGISRPLKSRILQIVASLARKADDTDPANSDTLSDDGLEMEEEGLVQRHRIVHLYEICGLLLFYAGAVDKCLQKVRSPSSPPSSDPDNADNPLLLSIRECLDEATRGYEATTRVYAARLDALAAITGDSEAALARSLVELLATVRVRSPGFSSGIEYPSEECRNLLSMEWCANTLVRGALAHCRTVDHVVVLKQAVAVAKKAGVEKFVMVERLDEAIDEKESLLIDEVVAREANKVLEICGLSSLVANLQRWKESKAENSESEGDPTIALSAMASFPGLSSDDVEAGIKEFYASLYSPPLPSLETSIKDPLLRKTARTKIAGRVVEAYADIYQFIMECSASSLPGDGYIDVSFLGHTPDQVKTLFSV